jgi:hypothetical protein
MNKNRSNGHQDQKYYNIELEVDIVRIGGILTRYPGQ